MTKKPKADEGLKEHVLDMLDELGGVTAKFMFGGWGLTLKGTFFGLIIDGALYLKTNEQTRKKYEEKGCGPFTYARGVKTMTMAYHQVPEDVFEVRERLLEWVNEAVRVAAMKKKRQ